jgi:hypothetical protein
MNTLRSLAAAVVLTSVAAAGTVGQSAPASASDPTPVVWVGSPLGSSTWPTADGCGVGDSTNCSLPSEHHAVYPNTSNGELGDWAMDLQSVAVGAPVVLYAAPQDGSLPVTATVQAVAPACASGVISDGGYRVTVELSTNGAPIGTVTYAHLDPSVQQGQVIDRWGSQVGTVGSYDASGCWQGVHSHVELSNQTKYSCYNSSFVPGQQVDATNFIGFLGGDYASGRHAACP